MKQAGFSGNVAIGLISARLTLVGCDRVASSELQAGQSSVQKGSAR